MIGNRNSFVFYKSFFEAIDGCPIENQRNIYRAICAYSLYGEETQLQGLEKAIFTMAKPQLDANTQRYLNGCRGGAPKGSSNNPNGRRGNKPKTNQELTKNKPNDNDNVNDNKKKLSKESKEKDASASFSTHTQDCDERLFAWIKDNAPYIVKNFEHLVSSKELEKLKEAYSSQQIQGAILAIENRKDLRKNYTNLYRTLINWLKREASNG